MNRENNNTKQDKYMDSDIIDFNEEEIEAYLKTVEEETPDLWDRVSAGFDIELINKDGDKKDSKVVNINEIPRKNHKIFTYKTKKYIIAVAALIFIAIIAAPIINDRYFVKYSNDMTQESVNDNNDDWKNDEIKYPGDNNTYQACEETEKLNENNDLANSDESNDFANSDESNGVTDWIGNNVMDNTEESLDKSACEDMECDNSGGEPKDDISEDINRVGILLSNDDVEAIDYYCQEDKGTLSKKEQEQFIRFFNNLNLCSANMDFGIGTEKVIYNILFKDGSTYEVKLKPGYVCINGETYSGYYNFITKLINFAAY